MYSADFAAPGVRADSFIVTPNLKGHPCTVLLFPAFNSAHGLRGGAPLRPTIWHRWTLAESYSYLSAADIVTMRRDLAIEALLELDGSIIDQGSGYWIKFEAWRVEASPQIPYGIRYSMKPIVIGIMPQEQIRERALAIARGDYKPGPNEPKVWFTSMKSLSEVLSDDNRALLKVITETNPESISALAAVTGRQPGNLSRTLKTMSHYGIVDLQREENHVRPVVKATEFRIIAA